MAEKQKYIKWTEDETRAVVEGVAKHGVKNWKAIKSDPAFAEILRERTGVNIKDKHRNLETKKKKLLDQQKKEEAEAKHENEELAKPPPTPHPFLSVEVSFNPSTTNKMVQEMKFMLSVHKDTVVEEIIKEIKSMVVLSHNGCDLKLCSVFQNAIVEIIPNSKPIQDVAILNLQAKEVDEYECSSHILAPVCHFQSHTTEDDVLVVKRFGVPFLCVLRKGDTLQDVKTHIQKVLNIGNEELTKWKIASLANLQLRHLKESDDLFEIFQENEARVQFGLEH